MRPYSTLKTLATACLLASSTALMASDVDITLASAPDGQLEVKLRPSANFDGMVSSLVFTIRWDEASNAHLGTIQQATPSSTYIPISRSGGEQDAGGDRYQIFVGFGMTPMQWIPTDWVAGQEYTVMTIPVEGTSEFSLVNDTWTGMNNADYYLALGGVDDTGTIYGDVMTGIVAGQIADGQISVVPNPTAKASMITMQLHTPQDVRFELVNAAGQVVWKKALPKASGIIRQPLDMSTFDKGVYLLRVHTGAKLATQRVVKR